MSRILLISPPERQVLMEAGDRPNMGLLYVAGEVIRSGRHEAWISDLNHDSYRELNHKIKWFNPEFIGLTTITPYFHWWSNFAKHLKHNYPNIKLVAGGPHATVKPQETLNYFDYVVVGEGEKATVDLMDQNVNGPIICRTPSKLDDLAGPDWEGIELDNYGINQEGYRTMTLLSSRSCSQNCFFCTKDMMGRTQRCESPDKTLVDILTLRDKGFKSLYFVDDCFTENRNRVYDLMDKMKHLGMTFRATARTDQIDREYLAKMKEGGLRSISFGLEHMDDNVLMRIQKHNNSYNNTMAVQMAKSMGLKIRGSFILNLPGATKKSMYDCLDFAMREHAELDFADFYPLIAYPGTQIWENPERYSGRITDRGYHFFQTHGRTNVEFEMPSDEFYPIAEDIRKRWREFKKSEVPWETDFCCEETGCYTGESS